tara:strand:- start:73 stop:297 length:225 start_codon:yes stop_codon:yes gene_type:complete
MVKLVMKNSFVTVRDKMVSKYLQKNNNEENEIKSTDINVLLNRVKLDQKKESRKKLLFSAAASVGVVLFGVLIF